MIVVNFESTFALCSVDLVDIVVNLRNLRLIYFNVDLFNEN